VQERRTYNRDKSLERKGLSRYVPTREEIDAECAKIRAENMAAMLLQGSPKGVKEPGIREVKVIRGRGHQSI
jgi:type IV secretory pathway component VirB8